MGNFIKNRVITIIFEFPRYIYERKIILRQVLDRLLGITSLILGKESRIELVINNYKKRKRGLEAPDSAFCETEQAGLLPLRLLLPPRQAREEREERERGH